MAEKKDCGCGCLFRSNQTGGVNPPVFIFHRQVYRAVRDYGRTIPLVMGIRQPYTMDRCSSLKHCQLSPAINHYMEFMGVATT